MLSFVIVFTRDNCKVAIVDSTGKNNNLHQLWDRKYPGKKIDIVWLAPSRKKAIETANAWNDAYKENNELLGFDEI